MQSWLEIGKFVAGIATPIVVAIIGILLLRRVEGVKALVAKQSEFQKKWAEEFFASGQQFLRALERDFALLTVLFGLKDPQGKLGNELYDEVCRLNATLTELELRIRRCIVFAPCSGEAVTKSASDCFTLTAQLLATHQCDFDVIVNAMNEFNKASRKAHAEMLGLSVAEQGAPADAPQSARP